MIVRVFQQSGRPAIARKCMIRWFRQMRIHYPRLYHAAFWTLLVCIVFLTAFFVVYLRHRADTLRIRVAELALEKELLSFEKNMNEFFKPMSAALAIAVKRFYLQRPALEEPALLNAYYIPMLARFPHIAAAIIANTEGEEYFLLRTHNKWKTRLTGSAQTSIGVMWHEWNNEGELLREWREEISYDPRSRPWFRGAVDVKKTNSVFWTPVYSFFTKQIWFP